ncbi:MAG: Assimilatory nitrate reductase large subunit, partial [Proteobacteria bacterium]|nr:Assimilatory nitrate reductase large subunit [Pseudomonadota bacterium]
MPTDTRTTCPYCGVGCGVLVRVDDDGQTSVKGDPDHPANFGRLCSKGAALAETLSDDGRILHPEIGGRQAGWDEALDLVAGTFAEVIAAHGPEAVAFYLSGQLLTEDYYVANKLMKGFIGAANIDTNSRLCMASSVAGHRRAFGADTVPGNYEDIELADLVVIVGSNMAWCHPVLYQRLAAAKAARPEMAVVVIDPRRTATSDIADLHLAVRADGDVALFNGLLAHLADSGRIDRDFVAEHTAGLGAALAEARRTDPADLRALTGLDQRDIDAFYGLFAGREKTVTLFSQGVNQSSSGSDKVNAIINCHLLTGRIGRPGMGPLSLTGQPNAMGGREVGGLANMLAAHMNLDDAADRDRVGRFWTAPNVAERPGLKAVDLFEAVGDGRIKALWIMATNPVVSMPDADRVRAAIEACPFVVVSDIQRDTDTARLAHVLLPSLGWSEKSGTVTNSERRISRQRGFRPGPGEARADWWQFAEVGRRLGFTAAFAYAGPHQVFAEHAGLSGFENGGARDFDISAHATIDAAGYEGLAPFQWPQPAGTPPRDSRFFSAGRFYHADGRARFVAAVAGVDRRTNWGFPFVLNTGRIRDHWHTMTRTGKSARLSAHLAEPFAEIHPADAAALKIGDADLVEVSDARGARVIVRALLTDRQARGNLFVPMHWSDETSALARVNALFPGRVDAVSGQPALKHTAVRLRRHVSAAHGFLVSSEKPEGVDSDYWALARTEHGWRLELAGSVPTEGWDDWLRRVAGLPAE